MQAIEAEAQSAIEFVGDSLSQNFQLAIQQYNEGATEQRILEESFRQQLQSGEESFRSGQRRLDLQNAELIRQTLSGSVFGAALQARAEGGPVVAGKPYLVGERGPELFVPRASGQILPATTTSALTMAGVEQRLEAILSGIEKRPPVNAPATYQIVNDANPIQTMAELSAARLRAIARGGRI